MRDIAETIEQVRAKIVRYKTSRPINEESTRAALIEPIIRSLGWDVEDLEEVQREYKPRKRDKPVDYALMSLRQPRLFIETKALGENLADHRWANQIMGYAAVAGVKWVVLTDGDEYRLYNSHAPVVIDAKLFRTVRISDNTAELPETLALFAKEQIDDKKIEVLWNAHFVDSQVHKALDDLFSGEPDPSLVRILGKRTAKLSAKDIRAALGRVRVRLEFPVAVATSPSAHGSGAGHRAPRDRGTKPASAAPRSDVSLADLIKSGLIKAPLDLEREYKGRRLTARIEADGRVTCLGKVCESLSTAGGMARASVIGVSPGRKYPQTNGWTFWRYRDPSGKLKDMDEVRQRHVRGKQS